MCGIFGYTGKRKNAAKIVLEGLKSLEYRGYDSWGVAIVKSQISSASGRIKSQNSEDEKILIKKRAGKIGEATVSDMPPSSLAFGHTRWATHGGVTQKNAHPHLDCTGTIALIHNGIVENFLDLKKELVASGHRFISETDTEVAVHLVEEYAKTHAFTKAVQLAFNRMDGLNAIIVMKSGESQFVAVRNGSPLVVGFGDDENLLASDAAALLPYTKQVHFLEDKQMAIVGPKGVMMFHVETGHKITPHKQMLNWTVAQAAKGQYDYYMMKEIHEQPGILTDIATNSTSHDKTVADHIKHAEVRYFLGCGTAAHASLAGTYMFSIIANTRVNWAIGSEFIYRHHALSPSAMVLALSQSGETMDTLEAVKFARAHNAKVTALVNVLGSTLYREADYKMLIGAGPEKSVASTKAFIGKLAHLLLLAYAYVDRVQDGRDMLIVAAKSAQAVLKPKNQKLIQKIAKRIVHHQHIYVIGRGLSYPAALEVALKIKEISYIHAEGFAAGELKHGMLALVENDSPCVVIAPNDDTYSAVIAGAMEMKARGGYIIGISHKNHEIFDEWIPVVDAGVATIIPTVISGQLLAYYLTIEKGLDPDMPRNLAKSVTVK